MLLTSAYAVWIQVVRHYFGSFPYPFLNTLPHPRAIIVTTIVGHAVVALIIGVSRGVSRVIVGRPAASAPAASARPRRTKLA
jgi:uncharacterized membrane protein